ncbi:MAG: hypothetical protein ACREUU_05630 [Gammaproteobacteria bacterium]
MDRRARGKDRSPVGLKATRAGSAVVAQSYFRLPSRATAGGQDAPVLAAEPQSQFAALDQVNVRLPRTLAGRGEVDLVLTVDGKAANTAKVSIR